MLDALPVELATEIFKFALPDILSDPHPSQAPLLLAQVCRDWRRLTLDTPQLWSNLTLSDGNVHHPPTLLIEQWLNRAKLVALSLWIGHQNFPDSFMYLISWNRTKWKALEFHSHGFPLFALSKILSGGFPSLRKLVIDSKSLWDQDFYSRATINGFTDAPLLKELHLEGSPPLSNKIYIPWSQLTRYLYTTRTVVETYDVLRILSRTPNLLHCSLTASAGFRGETSSHTVPPLTHLKSLTFPRGKCAAILPHLTLPALESLDVGLIRPEDVDTLISFLTRSSCKLDSLSANAREILLAPLIPALRTMPTLSSLRLTIISSDETISTVLQRLGYDASFLPNLKELTIVSDGSIVFPYEMLVETIKARSTSESLAPLRRIALRWTGAILSVDTKAEPPSPDTVKLRSVNEGGHEMFELLSDSENESGDEVTGPSFFPDSRIKSQLLATGVVLDFGFDLP
ncbi:hypothetical protein DFH06DRAFT_502161 [Mycena polygramma]|nr:hypothetical protein DFH06DRAFT_502161 [Mycena polygramma]